jgi:gliding motility-associated-like protein
VLTSVSEYNCVNSDSVTIFVEVVNLLVVPNAFSPNNDGHNDLFRILRTLNVEQLLEFKVFNRWGQLIFETNDIRQGWDGTFNGVTQELGVYAFVIQVLNRDGEKIVKGGNVTLVK